MQYLDATDSKVWPAPHPARSTPTLCTLPEEPTSRPPVIVRPATPTTRPPPYSYMLQSSLFNGSNRHRRGRPEKSWFNCLTDDFKAFEISEGEWETLAKDRRSRWCERVSQGAVRMEVYISAWRDIEHEVSLTRHTRQAEKRASTMPHSAPRGCHCLFSGSLQLAFCLAHRALRLACFFFVTCFLGGVMYLVSVLYHLLLYGGGRVPDMGCRFLAWPRAVSCATSPIIAL